MDKTDGSIRLYRCILDSRVFAHQTALKIWIWCLCKASYKERNIPLQVGVGTTIVKLLPGQFIFGRHKAEQELKIDESTIYRWIKKFASKQFDEMINIKSNNQFSIITISKWDEYQSGNFKSEQQKEQPKNNHRTGREQPQNTYNNVNKVNNVNKKKEVEIKISPHPLTEKGKPEILEKPDDTSPISQVVPSTLNTEYDPHEAEVVEFEPPTPFEVANYCNEMSYEIDQSNFFIYYEIVGWMIGEGDGEPIKNWKAAVDKWNKNPEEIEIPEYAFRNSEAMPKKSKRKAIVFKPPTLDETIKYFSEHGFDEKLARRAFEGYDVADWHDSRGNKIKNWKQKMIQVWFREEQKIKTGIIEHGQHPGQNFVSGNVPASFKK